MEYVKENYMRENSMFSFWWNDSCSTQMFAGLTY